MITKKMLHNANKVGFIVQQYPEHKLAEVIKLMAMPAIDINTAIWAAEELGFIGKPDRETGNLEFLVAPERWDFGPEVTDLQEALVYSFTELAKVEKDLEENYMSSWTQGYPTQDVLVAVKQLLVDRVLAEYEINDVDETGTDNVYIFYTLFENSEQLWGRKEFKKDPIDTKPGEEG